MGAQSLMSMAAVKNWGKQFEWHLMAKGKANRQQTCPASLLPYPPWPLRESLHLLHSITSFRRWGVRIRTKSQKTWFPGKEYRFLTAREKNSVRAAQWQQYQWLNNADIETVFAASCTKVVQVAKGGDPSPCPSCMEVLKNRQFKQAISIPLPDEKNLKFTPKRLWMRQPLKHYAHATGLQAINWCTFKGK